MTPPPTMTTSALSTDVRNPGLARALHHSPHLEDELQRRERRDIAVVKRRRDLDDVEPHQAPPCGRAAQQSQRLSRGQATRGWDVCARGKRRLDPVDAERGAQL